MGKQGRKRSERNLNSEEQKKEKRNEKQKRAGISMEEKAELGGGGL